LLDRARLLHSSIACIASIDYLDPSARETPAIFARYFFPPFFSRQIFATSPAKIYDALTHKMLTSHVTPETTHLKESKLDLMTMTMMTMNIFLPPLSYGVGARQA